MDPIFAAKFLAIPGGFLLGSYNFTFSQNVVPHIFKQPASVTAPIFAKIYNIGASTILPVAATSIAAYAYLAYTSNPEKRRLYGTAAVLMFATLPLTQVVMKSGIDRLLEISKESSLQTSSKFDAEATALLKTWVAQNYFRSSLHLTAGLIGLYTVLS